MVEELLGCGREVVSGAPPRVSDGTSGGAGDGADVSEPALMSAG
jgi:hypothetical protein